MRTALTASLILNVTLVVLLVTNILRSEYSPDEAVVESERTPVATSTPEAGTSGIDDNSNGADQPGEQLTSSTIVSQPRREGFTAQRLEEVPALPGLSGYDVSNPMMAVSGHPALSLADEPRDPVWAAEMESRLLQEIQLAADGPMTMLQAECRTSWCGVVIDLPQGEDRQLRMNVGDQFRDSLKFDRISRVGHGRSDGSSFIAVYLQAER